LHWLSSGGFRGINPRYVRNSLPTRYNERS
jgi:hypothetical protein